MNRRMADNHIPYNERLPKGWTEFSPIARRRVSGTRFFPCRVPLKAEYFDVYGWHRNVPRFTPKMLKNSIPDIGLVIDHADTPRYYDKEVFPNFGIDYVKIPLKGKQIPQDGDYQKFREVVDDFLADDEMEGKVIVVHCTHGVNRTGYMICRYMIEKMGMTANDAVEKFNTARGHSMEKYIDELEAIEQMIKRKSLKRTASHDLASGGFKATRKF